MRIGEIVVAEVSTVVNRFLSEDRLVSWAGLCPEARINAANDSATRPTTETARYDATMIRVQDGK